MSLVIFVSQKTVIISKFGLEFGFTPPSANLTKAAISTYRILKQSRVLQAESSRDQKDEVITLLKTYGEALYKALIPEKIRPQVYKAGGLFIFAREKSIMEIPWELLFDGSSFFALTQGLIRINESAISLVPEVYQYEFPSLKLSFNAYQPLEQQSLVPAFGAYIEELAAIAVPRSPLVEMQVNGNAQASDILGSLKINPNIFFFSGYDSEVGWTLKPGPGGKTKALNWQTAEFKPHLQQAIKNGLKMVVLQTSYLLEQPPQSVFNPIKFLFDCGVPFVIAVHGRLARDRFKEYLNIFLLNLIREENISRAHRLAINHIQSSLPLSWDWSWIRFHINQKLLESTAEQPLPPFRFDRSSPATVVSAIDLYPKRKLLHKRRFFGSSSTLQKLDSLISKGDRKSIFYFDATKGNPIETYLGEWLRRQASTEAVSVSIVSYKRWGFSEKTQSRLQSSKFGNLFSFLTDTKRIETEFDQCLIHLNPGAEKQNRRLLFVYTPPTKPDHQFDDWLSKKQAEGWQIVFLVNQSHFSRLSSQEIELNSIGPSQVINCFEDGLPENWNTLLESDLPACMADLQLLKIIQKSKNPDLIDYVNQNPTLDALYQATFQTILSSLSASRLKLLISLYLVKISFPQTLLIEILNLKGGEQDLKALYDFHLIEANLAFEDFWVPIHLQSQIDRLNLIPQSILKNQGQELLQDLIAYKNVSSKQLRYLETGFQNCLLKLVELDELEYPLHRNLQFGKKMTRRFQDSFCYGENILTSLELAIHAKKGHLIQKTLFSLVEILEELPFARETINLCQWLLEIEKKHRNWPLVSELQTRMASIYASINEKEKAIGLISSAIKLNNDIKNYSSRYKNLITIALLLLDLEEFEKLSKLLTTANFDTTLLNKEDMARLWLIDGHMLYHNRKYQEAEGSFKKIVNNKSLNVSESLMAKTYLFLADISNNNSNAKNYALHLASALKFIESSGDLEKTAEIREELYELSIADEDLHSAVKHLEWIFNYYKEAGNKQKTQQAADLLGGLYFKIGEHSKSTELYSIAQGI